MLVVTGDAEYALTEAEMRLGAADLDADAADTQLEEANFWLHQLAGQRNIGAQHKECSVAVELAVVERDKVREVALSVARERYTLHNRVEDCEATLKANEVRSTELLIRWSREAAAIVKAEAAAAAGEESGGRPASADAPQLTHHELGIRRQLTPHGGSSHQLAHGESQPAQSSK